MILAIEHRIPNFHFSSSLCSGKAALILAVPHRVVCVFWTIFKKRAAMILATSLTISNVLDTPGTDKGRTYFVDEQEKE
jgi:hypothetical protein